MVSKVHESLIKMKKYYFFIVFALVTIFLIFVLKKSEYQDSPVPTPKANLSYSNIQYGFSLVLPADWSKQNPNPKINKNTASMGKQNEEAFGDDLTFKKEKDGNFYYLGIYIFTKLDDVKFRKRLESSNSARLYEYLGENEKYKFYFYKYTYPECGSDCPNDWKQIEQVKDTFKIISPNK